MKKTISLIVLTTLLSGCAGGMQVRNDPNTPVDDILMPIFMVMGR